MPILFLPASGAIIAPCAASDTPPPDPAGGGHNSGWQDSRFYVDTGLSTGVVYTYTVKARDMSVNLNETAEAEPASAIPVNPDIPITVENYSFELPGTVKQNNWEEVPSQQRISLYPVPCRSLQFPLQQKLFPHPLANKSALNSIMPAVDGSVWIMYGLCTKMMDGDFNCNGMVNLDDISTLTDFWLENDCNETIELDLNDDCVINFYEFSLLARNWLEEF